jgi:hypothetical protein
MEISFPADSDGFLSQECPSCEQRFRVLFGQGSEEPILFCPYCGYRGQQCWYTTEQVSYIRSAVIRNVIEPELMDFGRKLETATPGLLKIGVALDVSGLTVPPIETDDELHILRFSCCGETIKAKRCDRLFCIICGMEVQMSLSESKRVFLSHKGVDKEIVYDFKRTLEVLGYDPWLDEDAMPAGTPLERGLLKGMQESCGVIFFITPSFKDEGYLETEVNYAIAEKRAKGEKFAIVALQFIDKDGDLGEIPSLLKTYVWKKPRTPLEALREIVRALPVVPGAIDWRSSIAGVVTTPQPKSTSTQLSEEAISILTTAAGSDGQILHMRYMGGEEIHCGGKSLIPNQEARTIARWAGGLEDLQRRRYVKDLGHKGEVFEITREGYEAMDVLLRSQPK